MASGNKIVPNPQPKEPTVEDLALEAEETAASPEDSLERKEYLKVIEQTTPFWITKTLGTPKLWLLIGALALFYVICIVLVATLKLYALDDIIANDFFVRGNEITNRWFIIEKMG